jgi:SAM-dependent methyltransferase
MMLNPTSTERVVSPLAVSATVVKEIGKNLLMTIPAVSRLRAKRGRTALPPEPDQLQRYVFDLFESVTTHSGNIAGKSVLEIGPGDNLVTGLAFMAAGAKSYTALDRFPGDYASDDARRWYRLLADHWSYGDWPVGLDPDRFPDHPAVFSKGHAVESAGGGLDRYDVVCSFAVGEHVSDIDQFARLTHDALSPGGVAVHVIDFGGHQWNRFGDPFLFLKFPDAVWQMMGSARGEPNRVRFDAFKSCFERAGLTVEVPFRLSCTFDASDKWVAQRADADFLTTEAIFILRRTD